MKKFSDGEINGLIVVGPSPNPHRPWGYEVGSARRIRDLAGAELEWWNIYDVEPRVWIKATACLMVNAWLNGRRAAPRADDTMLLLLGRKVADAFGFGWGEWLSTPWVDGGTRALLLPHPSGLNRWWNDPANVTMAEHAIREAREWVR